MTNARQILFEEAQAHAESLPVRRRIQLLRALAEFAGNEAETNELRSLAADLEAADHRCREFAFRFSAPTKGLKP